MPDLHDSITEMAAMADQTGAGAAVLVARCAVGGDGLTVVIKDCIDVAGLPTCAGSRALANAPAAHANAAIVKSLLDSGCQIIGKSTMHELAFGVTGINRWAGTPVNPQFPDLIPGGSSSGSAVAVAAGLCDFAIGTDTGGSVRVPAACCGIYGLKPTFGRLSRAGMIPADSSLDCIGSFARSASELVYAMHALDPNSGPLPNASDLKVAWLENGADAAIGSLVRSAITIAVGDMPAVRASLFDAAHQAGLTIIGYEASRAYAPLLASGMVGADVAARLRDAAAITDAAVTSARAVGHRFAGEIDALFDDHDILALPTLPVPPPHLADAEDLMKMVPITSLCRPFNVSGHPALTMPVGLLDGRPVSLQLVARRGADENLLAMAAHIEREIGKRPFALNASPDCHQSDVLERSY